MTLNVFLELKKWLLEHALLKCQHVYMFPQISFKIRPSCSHRHSSLAKGIGATVSMNLMTLKFPSVMLK
jgi:hypothetical protein